MADDLDDPLAFDDEAEFWVQCPECGHAVDTRLSDLDCGDPNCPGRHSIGEVA